MKKLHLSPLASPCSRCPLRCAADAVRRACAGRDAVTHRLHPLFSAQATLRAFVTMGMGRGPPSGRPISLPQGAIRPRLPLLPPWQEERAAGGRRSCTSGQAPSPDGRSMNAAARSSLTGGSGGGPMPGNKTTGARRYGRRSGCGTGRRMPAGAGEMRAAGRPGLGTSGTSPDRNPPP